MLSLIFHLLSALSCDTGTLAIYGSGLVFDAVGSSLREIRSASLKVRARVAHSPAALHLPDLSH